MANIRHLNTCMFQLPESPTHIRRLRMAAAFLICVSCTFIGWIFINVACDNIANLPTPTLDQPPRVLTRAILPGILGAYLWAIAFAFLIFTLVKIDIHNKQAHLHKFMFALSIGRKSFWLTAPLAVLWVIANLYVRTW